MMAAPPVGPVAIPTCVGCGAMSLPGSCAAGCHELKLMLVRAAALGQLTELEEGILARVAVLRAVADELLDAPPPVREWPVFYESLRMRAYTALRQAPEDRAADALLQDPTEPATTWWCDRCGGIDAPQPCLGICVWVEVDWVPQDAYLALRERVLGERRDERRLRALVRRVALTTPRPGRHEDSWRAFAAEAAGSVRSAACT